MKKERPSDVQKQDKPRSAERKPAEPTTKRMAIVQIKDLQEVAVEVKLKLQLKGFSSDKMQNFFFKPFNRDGQISIKAMRGIFELNGIEEKPAFLLARYVVEPRSSGQVDHTENASVTQAEIIQGLQELIGEYPIFPGNKVK